MSSETRQRKLNQQRQKIKENQTKKHNQQLKSIQINDNETKFNLKFSLFKDECSLLVRNDVSENESTSKFAYDGPQAFELSNNGKPNSTEIDIFHLNNSGKTHEPNTNDKSANANVQKHESHTKKSNREYSTNVGFNYTSMKVSESECDTDEDFEIEKCNTTNESMSPRKVQNQSNIVKDRTMTTESLESNPENCVNVSSTAVAPSSMISKQNEVSSTDDIENIQQNNLEEDARHSFHDNILDSNTEIESFVSKPAPEDYVVKCRITRDKRGVDKGMYPTYYLHLERKNAKPLFLLAARRRKLSKTSNYLISCDATDMKRQGFGFLAKLRSNFIGTHFTLYDNGRSSHSKTDSKKPLRKELAAIIYETNVLGFKGPRKMTLMIPGMTSEKVPIDFQPESGEDDLLECCRKRKLDNLLELYNKKPIWNEDSQSYVLNFHGRVTQASVKNFQIVHENDAEYIIMQFGRTSDHSFSMDFAYPLSAIQAFGIALSSFDGKLACE